MGEGGWWTQLRRCAEGFSDHPYCMSCGPFVGWGGAACTVHGKEEYAAEEGELGEKADVEDIDWGSDLAAEAQAGCKASTVAHRTIQCPSIEAGTATGRRRLDELRKKIKERPWDPLFWRGIPALPLWGAPPHSRSTSYNVAEART